VVDQDKEETSRQTVVPPYDCLQNLDRLLTNRRVDRCCSSITNSGLQCKSQSVIACYV